MPGNGAEIGPLPDGPGAEGDRRACPDADDVLRCDVLFGEHDVVLSAFAIDQGDLDYVVFSGSKLRIDHAVDVRADPDEHHAALGNAGFERVSHIRRVAGRYRGIDRRNDRATGGLGRSGSGRRHSVLSPWRRGALPGRCGSEVGNDVRPIFRVLQPGVDHLGSVHVLPWAGEKLVQGFRGPDHVGTAHSDGIAIALQAPRGAADHIKKARPDPVLSGIDAVAGLTLAEDLLPGGNIALGMRRSSECGGERDQQYTCFDPRHALIPHSSF